MIPALRLHHALFLLAGSGGVLVPALFSSGCGPEAVGVESCRQIEEARCAAAAACGFTEDDVSNCKLLYADQCLHGIENGEKRPTEVETETCVAAVDAAGACAAAGTDTIGDCADAPVVAGAENRTPCEIVLTYAHELAGCAFVVADADAGTTTSSDTTTTTSSDTTTTTE